MGEKRLPKAIYVEPTNGCNLRCRFCFQSNATMNRPIGMMDYVTFKKIVDDVAKSLGIKHIFIELKPRDVLRGWDEIIDACEGYIETSLGFGNIVKDRLPPTKIKSSILVDGFSGDVIYGANYFCKISRDPKKALKDIFTEYRLSPKADEETIAAKLKAHFFNEADLRGLLTADVYEKIAAAKDEADKEILEYVRKYRKQMDSTEGTIEMFKIKERGRRYVNFGGQYLRRFIELVYPFFDYDVIDLYLTIPMEMRAKHHLYYKLYQKKFPQLGKIPCVHTGIPPNWPFLLQKIFKYAHYFRKGIIEGGLYKLTKGRFFSRKSYYNYSHWIKTENNRRFMLEKMNPQVIKLDYAKKLLDDHAAYRKDNSAMLAKALTFGLWYSKYVEHP